MYNNYNRNKLCSDQLRSLASSGNFVLVIKRRGLNIQQNYRAPKKAMS